MSATGQTFGRIAGMPTKQHRSERVTHVEHPHAVGTVLAREVVGSGKGVEWARVQWDGYDAAQARWHRASEVQPVHGRRLNNPQTVPCTPEIQALEVARRLDPHTELADIERDPSFDSHAPKPLIGNSRDLYEAWKGMGLNAEEGILSGMLSVRSELLAWRQIHKGQLDQVEANIGNIIDDIVLMRSRTNAKGIAMAHNHPTGNPEPSEADDDLTKAVLHMCEMLNLVFFDHLVIGRPAQGRSAYFSYRDAGLLPPIDDGEDN